MGVSKFELTNGALSGAPEEDAIAVHIDDFGLPSVLICKFKVPLYYGNAEFFMHQALSIVRSAPPRLRWFILRFDSIDRVDFIAAKMLMELADRMRKEEVALVFAELSTDLRFFLSDSGVLAVVGSDRVFVSVDAALAAVKHSTLNARRARKMS